MTSQRTLNARTIRLNISDAGPRFGSTKLGTAAARGALTLLTVLSALLLIAARPAQAQTETVLYNFTGGSDGGGPLSSLTSHGGNFYGTTQGGGAAGAGTVFELLPNGSGGWNETVLYNFCSEGGSGEVCTNGATPNGPVVFDSVGNLYGTTPDGGNTNCDDSPGCGVAFELSPAEAGWTETVLYAFCSQGSPGMCPGGAYPGGLGQPGSLVMDPAGNLYSTDASGVFELSPSAGGWTEKVIYYVGGFGGLTMDAAGNIFGVGVSDYTGKRIVFELSPNGKGGWNSTVIYTFTTSPNPAIWSRPALDQAGNLYGTETGWYNVYSGPVEFFGTVYKLSPGETGWTKRVIYTFSPDDSELEGNAPSGAGLVLDAAGNVYGTTIQGGTDGQGLFSS